MIKELLIKTRGATTLEPAGPIEQRRDSASSNGSSGSQIVLQVTKAPFEPQMKLLPNVSLILTPTTSTLTSNLTVTSIPMPKTRILPQGLISQAPSSASTPVYASEVLKVILFFNCRGLQNIKFFPILYSAICVKRASVASISSCTRENIVQQGFRNSNNLQLLPN